MASKTGVIQIEWSIYSWTWNSAKQPISSIGSVGLLVQLMTTERPNNNRCVLGGAHRFPIPQDLNSRNWFRDSEVAQSPGFDCLLCDKSESKNQQCPDVCVTTGGGFINSDHTCSDVKSPQWGQRQQSTEVLTFPYSIQTWKTTFGWSSCVKKSS